MEPNMEPTLDTKTESAEQRFAYDLIRNDVLKDILGSEHDSIMYWIGRSLARKYPLHTIEETIDFFRKANWGQLVLVKEKKQQRSFELRGSWMKQDDNRCYQLETGFLAEQIEHWTGAYTGATHLQKKGVVTIQVESDLKDSVNQS
ncbi:YslB family protein [Bacillus sp. FJAT-45037]|uniref:YslB family protein n=1 Tax=Bacillus sp. FJAT-45037 TaxID=2011007 RepID=UPI001E622CEC|nr:YslB family protein [Bacillus sp. FJAT-45037]